VQMTLQYKLQTSNFRENVHLLANEVDSHSVFEHPWLTTLEGMSDLSFINSFRDYVQLSRVYGQHFSSYVKNAIDSTASTELRDVLIENLAEEEGQPGQPSHIALYEQMAVELGMGGFASALSENPLQSIIQGLLREKLAGTQKFVTLGALVLGSEYAVPRIYAPVLDRLRSFAEFALPASINFFAVHVECDSEHASRAIQALEHEVKTETDFIQLRFGALSALNLRQAMLDSIYIGRR
jgi:pyrroloquinoline quinone (PQQ) biosynthesis protein C